jgi:ABC-type Mn2+/Zn2+ transport system ATPase subunit
VRAGEFWFCLGRNGEGKTTLLRALLGVHRPQAGCLWLHPQLQGQRGVGFVPQHCDLNPALPTTVREFVLLGTVGTRLPRRQHPAHLQWALSRVGLAGMAGRDYWSLSGGQQQRALVARALVRRPRLLILDEPSSGFDLPMTEAFLGDLADLNRQERLTLFFVTHDLAMAVRYATHVVLLHAGRAVAGPCQEVLNQRTLERVYGVGVEITSDASGVAAVRVLRPGGTP